MYLPRSEPRSLDWYIAIVPQPTWVVNMEMITGILKKWGKGNEKLSSKTESRFNPVSNSVTRYEGVWRSEGLSPLVLNLYAGRKWVNKPLLSQYSKTNVMHFLFNLLRINGLYMFRALLAHLQALQKRHLAYCVRVISSGCTRVKVSPPLTLVQSTDITCTQYTRCRLCSTSWGWASNARNT
jgi:hypothetical protein